MERDGIRSAGGMVSSSSTSLAAPPWALWQSLKKWDRDGIDGRSSERGATASRNAVSDGLMEPSGWSSPGAVLGRAEPRRDPDAK